ncbi:hypothetical protein BT69DRAFT_1276158 [Atractiella rhizophila]|nr:hypothetical protein BT69DRAFT_1276158 [Atractiella rhizophila]
MADVQYLSRRNAKAEVGEARNSTVRRCGWLYSLGWQFLRPLYLSEQRCRDVEEGLKVASRLCVPTSQSSDRTPPPKPA